MYQTVKPRYSLSNKVIVIYEALLKELISWFLKPGKEVVSQYPQRQKDAMN